MLTGGVLEKGEKTHSQEAFFLSGPWKSSSYRPDAAQLKYLKSCKVLVQVVSTWKLSQNK